MSLSLGNGGWTMLAAAISRRSWHGRGFHLWAAPPLEQKKNRKNKLRLLPAARPVWTEVAWLTSSAASSVPNHSAPPPRASVPLFSSSCCLSYSPPPPVCYSTPPNVAASWTGLGRRGGGEPEVFVFKLTAAPLFFCVETCRRKQEREGEGWRRRGEVREAVFRLKVEAVFRLKLAEENMKGKGRVKGEG